MMQRYENKRNWQIQQLKIYVFNNQFILFNLPLQGNVEVIDIKYLINIWKNLTGQ